MVAALSAVAPPAPACDADCQRDARISRLRGVYTAAKTKAADDDQVERAARERYYKAVEGPAAYEAGATAAVRKAANLQAAQAVAPAIATLDSMKPAIRALQQLDEYRSSTTALEGAYKARIGDAQAALKERNTAASLDDRRAEFASELVGRMKTAGPNWLNFVFFVVTAIYVVRFMMRGDYTAARLLQLVIVLLLPFTVGYIAQLALHASPLRTLVRK
jgi:hypothetical protein